MHESDALIVTQMKLEDGCFPQHEAAFRRGGREMPTVFRGKTTLSDIEGRCLADGFVGFFPLPHLSWGSLLHFPRFTIVSWGLAFKIC